MSIDPQQVTDLGVCLALCVAYLLLTGVAAMIDRKDGVAGAAQIYLLSVGAAFAYLVHDKLPVANPATADQIGHIVSWFSFSTVAALIVVVFSAKGIKAKLKTLLGSAIGIYVYFGALMFLFGPKPDEFDSLGATLRGRAPPCYPGASSAIVAVALWPGNFDFYYGSEFQSCIKNPPH